MTPPPLPQAPPHLSHRCQEYTGSGDPWSSFSACVPACLRLAFSPFSAVDAIASDAPLCLDSRLCLQLHPDFMMRTGVSGHTCHPSVTCVGIHRCFFRETPTIAKDSEVNCRGIQGDEIELCLVESGGAWHVGARKGLREKKRFVHESPETRCKRTSGPLHACVLWGEGLRSLSDSPGH